MTSVLMNVYNTTDLHICTQAHIDMSAHSHTYTVIFLFLATASADVCVNESRLQCIDVSGALTK